VNANPELDAPFLYKALIRIRQSLLNGDGALDGIDGTWKFSQHAITGRVSNATVMLRNQAVHRFAMCGEVPHRSDLVFAHEPGIALHISCQYGR